MKKNNNLTNSTEYMSSALQQLVRLNDLVKAKPRLTSGTATDVWENITGIINDTETPILNTIISGLNEVHNEAVTTLTASINADVATVGSLTDNTVNGIFDDIIAQIQGMIDTVEGVINDIQGWFEDLIGNIGDLIDGVSEWVTNTINGASAWVVNSVNNIASTIRTAINNTIDSVGDWINTTTANIVETVNGVIASVGNWINTTTSDIVATINNTIQNIVKGYESAKQTVEDVFNDFIGWVNGAKNNLVAWWHGILANVKHFLDHTVIPNWDKLVKGANDIVSVATDAWNMVQAGDFQGALSIIDKLFTGAGLPAPVKALSGIVSVIAYFWETIHLQFAALELNAQKQAMINLALEPLDLSTATQAVYKGLMSEGEFSANTRLAGISKDKSAIVIDANRPLPTPGQVQDSFLRGEIDLKTHDQLLASYGLSPDNIELIKELYLIIPGVSDLIRMAVREAFTPEIAERFGQYEDLPKAFVEWGKKQGLTAEWCSRYWAAHWDLPSATMGFEMLHRGVIKGDDLKLLLRALDVMPFWREKLIQISYNPLTRVDVRRMYQMGVINESQVTRAYLDLGYNEEKAGWLTEFTKRYYTPEDANQQDEFKTLARSVYSQAYKQHIISEDEYRQFLLNLNYYIDDVNMLIQIDSFKMFTDDKLFDLNSYRKDWQKIILSAYDRGLLHANEVGPMLTELGYSDEEVSLELNLADYNRTLSIRNMVAQQIHDQYVNYIIDVTQLHMILDEFNFTPEETNRLQEEWDIERSLRTKRPPLSDLRKFLQAKIISVDEFLDELRGEGYNEKYISMYAQQLPTS